MARNGNSGAVEVLDWNIPLDNQVIIYVGFAHVLEIGQACDGKWSLLTHINKISGTSFQINGVSQDHFGDFL